MLRRLASARAFTPVPAVSSSSSRPLPGLAPSGAADAGELACRLKPKEIMMNTQACPRDHVYLLAAAGEPAPLYKGPDLGAAIGAYLEIPPIGPEPAVLVLDASHDGDDDTCRAETDRAVTEASRAQLAQLLKDIR
jgi:hypothetical protein